MTPPPNDHAEFVGAVHVHSRYSDGSGRVEDIISDALAAGLDFVTITDHSTEAAREAGYAGWHDGLLVVVGTEISFGRGAHLLVFGVKDCQALESMSADEALTAVRAEGGLAIAAHPEGVAKPTLGIFHRPWTSWDNPDFRAVELWSFMYDWIKDFRWRRFFDFHGDPHSKLSGPSPEVLARWDRAGRDRPVAAVGSLDAHARRLLFRRYTFFPYSLLFGTVATCVMRPELTGRAEDDCRAVMDAVASGRSYIANRHTAPARGFRYEVTGGGERFEMGSVVEFREGLTARIATPERSEIRLIADGIPLAAAGGTGAEFEIAGPAVYRVEARYAGRPWIYSNPIYVR